MRSRWLTAALLCALYIDSAVTSAEPRLQSQPAFEVASIKPNASGATRFSMNTLPSGRFVATNVTLRSLIARAYGISSVLEKFRLIDRSNSGRVLAARFDVEAKLTDGSPLASIEGSLRTLLAERFGLRVRRETREMPVYAIVVERTGQYGPQFRRTDHDCTAFVAGGGDRTGPEAPVDSLGVGACTGNYDLDRSGVITMRYSGPLSSLARRVQGFVDRPVVDATELHGSYEWTLTFAIPSGPNDRFAPSVFTAFREQLGLQLDPRTSPIESYIIDAVQLPEPN